jgi:hypothetical protein
MVVILCIAPPLRKSPARAGARRRGKQRAQAGGQEISALDRSTRQEPSCSARYRLKWAPQRELSGCGAARLCTGGKAHTRRALNPPPGRIVPTRTKGRTASRRAAAWAALSRGTYACVGKLTLDHLSRDGGDKSPRPQLALSPSHGQGGVDGGGYSRTLPPSAFGRSGAKTPRPGGPDAGPATRREVWATKRAASLKATMFRWSLIRAFSASVGRAPTAAGLRSKRGISPLCEPQDSQL